MGWGEVALFEKYWGNRGWDGGIRVPCGEFQLERGPPDLTDNPPAPELCNGESIGGQLGAGKQENR